MNEKPSCPSSTDLRDWADNPLSGKHFVTVHQDTLRALANKIDQDALVLLQMRSALEEIEDSHVPDQSAASGLPEIVYVLEWVAHLRQLARRGLKRPRYDKTFCSNCGREFGPGDHGFSHCDSHEGILGKL
jgi:hypothetical protein